MNSTIFDQFYPRPHSSLAFYPSPSIQNAALFSSSSTRRSAAAQAERKVANISAKIEGAVARFNETLRSIQDQKKLRERVKSVMISVQQAASDLGAIKKRTMSEATRVQCRNLHERCTTLSMALQGMKRTQVYDILPSFGFPVAAAALVQPLPVHPFLDYVSDLLDLEKPDFEYSIILQLLENNQLKEALAAAKNAQKLAPDDPKAYQYLGVVHSKLGKEDDAYQFFTKSIEKSNGTNHEAYYFRALATYDLRNFSLVLADLQQAFSLAPELYGQSAEFYFYLGMAYYQNEKFDPAVDAFTESLRIGSDDSLLQRKTYFELAWLQAKKGNFLESSRALVHATQKHGASRVYFFLKGLLALALDPHGIHEARINFDAARAEGVEVEIQLYNWFAALKRYDLILSYFEKTPPVTDLSELNYVLSDLFFQAHQPTYANRYFRTAALHDHALQLSPIDRMLLHAIRDSDSLDQFQEHLEKTATAMEKKVPSHSSEIIIGSLYFLSGNYKKAEQHLHRGAQKNDFYAPLLLACQQILGDDVDGAVDTIKHIKNEYAPIITAKQIDGIRLQSLLSLLLLFFRVIEDAVPSDRVLGTLLKISRILSSNEAADIPAPSSWLSWKNVSLGILAIGGTLWARSRFCRAPEVKKITITLQVDLPPPKPTERKRKPVEKPPEKVQVPDDSKQFLDTFKTLFASRTKQNLALEVQNEVLSANDSFSVLLDCHSSKSWKVLNQYKNEYFKAIKLIISPLISRTLENPRRWVFEMKKEFKITASPEVISSAVKLIEMTNSLVIKERDSQVIKCDPKVTVDFQDLIQFQIRAQWEAALNTLFRPCGALTFNSETDDLLVFKLTPLAHLQEHFIQDEAVDAVVSCLKTLSDQLIDVQIDYTESCIVIKIAKTLEVTGQPDSTLLLDFIRSKTEIPKTSPSLLQPPLVEPLIPSSSITVGFRASPAENPDQVRQRIMQNEQNDRETLQKMHLLITQLDEMPSCSNFAKKYYLVCLLECYKRLHFVALRPGETERAQTMRNALIHFSDWVEGDEMNVIANEFLQKKKAYADEYCYDNTVIAKYAIFWPEMNYCRLLVETKAEATDETEVLAKEKLAAYSKLYADLDGKDVQDSVRSAHKQGVVLSLRELLQQQHMRMPTKERLEQALKSNLLTVVGNQIAHGETVDPGHIKKIDALIPCLIDLLQQS